MSRIVVVGAGIGGCLAALTAKRTDPGANVQLLSTEPERFRYEPGTIDVLGYTTETDGPVERPLVAIRDLPEDHPYRLVGADDVREALACFDELLEDDVVLPYLSGRNRNALAPTVTGGVRPTSRYPAGLAAGLVSSQRPMHVVGFDQETHLDAQLVGDRLDAAVPYDVEATTVEFPFDPPEFPPLEAFGRALDENEETADGVPLREAVADVVRPELDIQPRVGFPAVLGVDDHEAVRRDLESRLQAELFEIPVGEPSLPGLRLRDRLFELVDDAGVERFDATVVDFEVDDGAVQSLHLAEDPETGEQTALGGDAYVLASGGIAAGGLVGTGDDIVEPVFDCPITQPEQMVEWSTADALGDHPFARFGVDVTDELRPTAGDQPLYENLFAAGTVLGGHNFVGEHSRGGVAVVTGYQAGRQAAEHT